jgi:hypothetical protein
MRIPLPHPRRTSVGHPRRLSRGPPPSSVMPTTQAQRGGLWVIFAVMGLVAVGATAGSLESIIHMASEFKLFSSS